MNKTKVMQILNSIDLGLNIIEEGQQLDMHILTESVRTDIEDLKEELNSKPVMPKIFDDWYKNHEISGLELDDAIEELHRCMEVWELGYASNIGMWINKNPKVNYRMCIEALMNGYEVSDDYGIETVN